MPNLSTRQIRHFSCLWGQNHEIPCNFNEKSLLLDRIAADTPDCTEASLKQHVSNLRKKMREAGGKDCIEAVWGIGFLLKV